ncbi:uncharacterized protein LOC120350386 [Nilaparvata lugens]|uniref:uncharacterized protein LOC120350386 n=1 Tax=Nilaparvata lugens TaxID=108931 RepID=UPI00193D6B7E|nr:uncharacterized protein LOC120350386 [Nilaparvata lugens]
MSPPVSKDDVVDLKDEILSNQNMLKDYLQFKFDRLESDLNVIVKKIDLMKADQDKNMSALLEENAQLRTKFDILLNRMNNLEQYNGKHKSQNISSVFNVRGNFNSEAQADNADDRFCQGRRDKFRQGRRIVIKDNKHNSSGDFNLFNRRENMNKPVGSKGKQNRCTVEDRKESFIKDPAKRDKHEGAVKNYTGRGSVPSAVSIFEEFILNKDYKEVCLCIELYVGPEDRKNLIKQMIDYTFSAKSSNFHELGLLLVKFVVSNVVASTVIIEILHEYLDDTIKYKAWIDIPKIFQYFSESLFPLIRYCIVGVSDLSKMYQTHIDTAGQNIKKFVTVLKNLLTEKFGNKWVSTKFGHLDLEVDMQNDNDKEDIQFVLFTNDTPDTKGMSMNELQSKLVDLIQNNVTGEDLHEWIQIHVGNEVLKPDFINVLTTAICNVSFDLLKKPYTEAKLKNYSSLLRKYVTIPGNHNLDVACLMSVADFVHKLGRPEGLLSMIFKFLWDTSLIEDEAFITWKHCEGVKRENSKLLESLESFYTRINV